jgi:hypothetical protein
LLLLAGEGLIRYLLTQAEGEKLGAYTVGQTDPTVFPYTADALFMQAGCAACRSLLNSIMLTSSSVVTAAAAAAAAASVSAYLLLYTDTFTYKALFFT